MLQDNKLQGWLEEASFAIDRFPEASNIIYIVRKLEKFFKFAIFLSHVDGYSRCGTQGGLLCNMMF